MGEQSIRAVTFDLWETLLHEDSARIEPRTARRVDVAFEVLTGAGLEVRRDTILLAHAEIWKRMEERWKVDRDYSFDEQVRLFLELSIGRPLNGSLAPDQFRRVADEYADAALADPPKLDDAAAGVLDVVCGWGLKIGLISNTGRTPGSTLRKILERGGVLKRFQSTLFSDETIVRKPSRLIFEEALKALGVGPAEAVHVGDSVEADIVGAKGAGMKTIHIWRPQGIGVRSDRAPDADYVVESLEQAPSILARLRSAG